MKLNQKIAREHGAEFFFDAKACQLTQNSGNVTGVIAQKADSSYIRLNAESGVILDAGDYSKNEAI